VLPRELAVALDIFEETSSIELAVVVSHDCDCVSSEEKEPYLEIVRASFVQAPKAEYTHGKNPRVLHLALSTTESSPVAEFHINNRQFLPKKSFSEAVPDAGTYLGEKERRELAHWIAARYRRGAFPDALVARLEPLKGTLSKIAKENPFSILGIYIGFDPQSEIIDPNEPYEVDIAIVFDADVSGSDHAAKVAEDRIRSKAELEFKTKETELGILWRSIHLGLCEAIADTSFSLKSALEMTLYRFEYISLRQDPPAPTPESL